MKKAILFSTLLSLLLFSSSAYSRTCNCIVDGGDWGDATTWDCAGGPAAGDTINIPAGITVNVNNVYVYSGAPMYINVYGTVHLGKPGSKLYFPCGSIFHIYPEGKVTRGPGALGGSAREIRICDILYWEDDDGPIDGEVIWGEPIPLANNDYRFLIEENNKLPYIFFSINSISVDKVIIKKAFESDNFETVYESSKPEITFTDNTLEKGTSYYKIVVYANGNLFESSVKSFTSKPEVGIYPNPAKDNLTINIDDTKNFKSVKIFSLTGKLMHQSFNANQKIDVANWEKGVYLVQIENINNISTTKLIVQ